MHDVFLLHDFALPGGLSVDRTAVVLDGSEATVNAGKDEDEGRPEAWTKLTELTVSWRKKRDPV